MTPAVSVDAVAVARHSERIRFAGHSYGEAEQKLRVAAPRPACSLPDRDSGRATLGQDGGCLNGTSIEADRAGDTSHDNTDLAALALDGVAENQGRQAGLCRSVGRRRQGKWRSGDDSDTSRRRALPVSRDDDACEIDVAPCSIQRRHGNRRLARANYDAPALGFSGRCRRTAAPGSALATAASKISRSPARARIGPAG
jgi:hypothetical protein